MHWLDAVYLGNTVREYLLSVASFVCVLAFIRLFKSVIIIKIKRIADKTKTRIDDVIVSFIGRVG